MTQEQWAKVLKRAHTLSGGASPHDQAFWDAVCTLVTPIDEAQIDTDIAATDAAIKAARIAELEAELAILRA